MPGETMEDESVKGPGKSDACASRWFTRAVKHQDDDALVVEAAAARTTAHLDVLP